MRRLALFAVAVTISAACQGVALPVPGGALVDGWIFPTAAPLPNGAVAVPIDVDQPPASVPADVDGFGCPEALHAPIRLVVDRTSQPPTVAYVTEAGQPTRLRWSYGISGREVAGVVEIVLPGGEVIVREGEVSRVALGGGDTGAGVFGVCLTAPHRVEDGPPP